MKYSLFALAILCLCSCAAHFELDPKSKNATPEQIHDAVKEGVKHGFQDVTHEITPHDKTQM